MRTDTKGAAKDATHTYHGSTFHHSVFPLILSKQEKGEITAQLSSVNGQMSPQFRSAVRKGEITVVAFDFDDTLSSFVEAELHAMRAAARSIVTQGFAHNIDRVWVQLFNNYPKLDWDKEKTIRKVIADNYGEAEESKIQKAVDAYTFARESKCVPYAGVHETLTALKEAGITICLLSNAPKFKIAHKSKMIDVTKYFEHMLTLEDLPAPKPDPSGFLKLAKTLGVDPTNILYCGDAYTDVYGAKKAGCHACMITHGLSWKPKRKLKKVEPDCVVSDIREVRLMFMNSGASFYRALPESAIKEQ